TLRPILRARQAGLHALQAVAAQALEGVLRLYGSRVIDNGAAARSDWALCDVVWEALALHSAAGSAGTQQHLLLAAELRRLVHTTASLACAHEYAQLERLGAGSADETAAPETVGVVGALCAVFTKRATAALPRGIRRRGTRCDGAEGELAKEEEEEEEGEEDPSGVLGADGARAFTTAAKQLAVAALVAVLDCVDRLRPARPATAAAVWRAHPLAAALGDLRVIAQFSDVEDPAMRGEGVCVLGIYQAQLSAAFMPVLAGFAAGGSDTQQMPPPLVALAATNTAAAVVVSGLVGGDRPTLLRILRLLAPATASFSSRLSSGTHSYSAQMLVVLRLNLLHAWAAIFDYAAAGSFHSCRPPASRLLLEALELHMPLLAGLWLDAIRDTAVAGLQPRDVYAELACLLGDQQTDKDNGFDPTMAG
ncbi:HEAT repeat-containing protein 5B, partial [Coemansia sp. RSA 2673]